MTGKNEIGSTPQMSEAIHKKINNSKLYIIPNIKTPNIMPFKNTFASKAFCKGRIRKRLITANAKMNSTILTTKR